MRMSFRAALALMAAALGSTADAAADAFSRVDANGDGTIDKAEASDHEQLFNQFDRLDLNRNGRLSDPEFSKLEVEGAPAIDAPPADSDPPHPSTPIPE